MKNPLLKFNNALFKVIIELFIPNKLNRSKIKAKWAKKNLQNYLISPEETQTLEDDVIIWQYWHQGEENAPKLIRKCLESVKKYNKNVRILSFDTIKDYVDLPQKYYDLVNSKKMPLAHFSDILRLYLLEKYGGLWIDSTIFLTDKIPENILNADFFVPQKDPAGDDQENKMSCFLIRAKKGSVNLGAIKASLEAYWNKNDFVLNYFMFEHISTMLYDFSRPCKEEWDKMPYYDASSMGLLQKIMFEKFNLETFNTLKEKTNIHKLSYKKIKETDNNTFYDKIISEDLQ